ncbi:Uncharacterized membrane protein [Clostridium acidisoli DSM 12555]|uniref:Uncharacterized membrane protein n=1 Tax=Clostridium acidisoli DSM 12555 TaxID=1121291 RepID=A0A1W1XDK6_9CLOT|nr:Uncharacterized membrane protein [Clostridium acidisoli DSM 12555]
MMNNYDLILFFTIYSFLGWIIETIFASINEKKIINRGFLTGPFCPIYGFGAVLVIRCSEWTNTICTNYFMYLTISVLFSIFLVTILEYITGFFLEKIFNCKWWDYSDNMWNCNGYICIKYSLLWGILAFMLVHTIHPVISQVIFSIPTSIKTYMEIFILLYFIGDTAKSVISTLDLRKVIMNYSNFSVNKYCEKIIKYNRFFYAFPRLLILNSGIINRDVRRILNERFYKIKTELKNRFQNL